MGSACNKEDYWLLAEHYQHCFARFGDTPQGADWPNANDLMTRYQVMLDVIRERNNSIKLLDFACGSGSFFSYLAQTDLANINYLGIDINDALITVAKNKFPTQQFWCLDILESEQILPVVDYVVCNGLFTVKRAISTATMMRFMQIIIEKLFAITQQGLAFNVMSPHVDWRREDLFYVDMMELTTFIIKHLTRNFVIRHDYGLYEYTCYLYR
ncbi:MAG: hypothetical protein Tsb005_16890 [Gammaproteobacteria bacterium]